MSLSSVQVQGADGVKKNAVGDEFGGNFYPFYKLGFGTLGSVTVVDAGNPLPVTIAGVSTAALQQQADLDTGAGTDNQRVTGLLRAESGGSILVGSANPLPTIAQFVNESGVAYGIKHIDNKPRVSAMPYAWDIAEGNFPDHTALRKFGHDSDVGTALEDVWDGSAVYVYLTAAERLNIASGDVDDQGVVLSSGTATGGSATTLIDTGATFATDTVAAGDIVLDDTNVECGYVLTVDSEIQITIALAKPTAFAAGTAYRVVNANDTGAAVVEVQGLDGNYESLIEYVVLATGANTLTVGSFIRVFRMKVLLAGASGWNEGLVTASNFADDNILAAISIGQNQTLMALWTVPNGKTAFLTSFYAATSSSKATEVELFVREFGSVFQIKNLITIFEGASQIVYDFPLPIPQRSDITIRASAAGGGGEVSAGFNLWYE